MKYCSDCGRQLVLKELENEGMVNYCPTCQQYKFPLYNIAVSMIVVNKENHQILLIKQYHKPDYILVAGYVNKGEALEDAVIREVKEETGMLVTSLQFNRTQFYEPSNTLMCNFTVFVDNDNELHTNNEVDSYHWFSYEEAKINIKPNSLAAYFLNQYLESQILK